MSALGSCKIIHSCCIRPRHLWQFGATVVVNWGSREGTVTHPQAYIHSQTNSVLHLCISPTQLLVSYDFCVLQPIPLYSCSGPLVEGESTTPSTSSWLVLHLLHRHCSNHESDKYEILKNGWPALATEYHAGIHPSVTNSAQFILDMVNGIQLRMWHLIQH